ncbi:carbohydrate ABC transporter permease [Microcella indica]|uniref:carbohydrate ABC transporter permease n=1 Tax=Microcella indica TaxID=2750620 RepID=UPI0015CF59A2|nr:carbohydrate ABC transporter permease [Microcella indica]
MSAAKVISDVERSVAVPVVSGDRSRTRRRADRTPGLAALRILLAVIVLFPVLWMLLTALKPQDEAISWPPSILPQTWDWENFGEVLARGEFARWFLNSAIVAIATVLGNLFVGIPAAFAFARMRFRGKNALFLLVLASLMIPGEVLLVPLFVLLSEWGWIDAYPALIVPFIANAFVIFLLKQFFETIPRELEEAAIIDGAGPLRVLRHVVVPLALPAIAVSSFFTFLGSWNSYLYPLVVTRSMEMRTVTVGLSLFTDEVGTDWPLMMAASALVAAPAIVVFLVIERHLKNTMAMSGLRG